MLEPAAAGPARRSERDRQTARAFLRARRKLLRLQDPDAELVLRQSRQDELGRVHLRFAQRHRGLEVWPSELIVHLDPAGNVDVLNGSFVPTPRVPVEPRLGASEAMGRARRLVPELRGARMLAPELIVYAPGNRAPRLAWRLRAPLSVDADWWVLVDAHDGAILNAFDRVASDDVPGSGFDSLGLLQSLRVWSEGGLFYLTDTSKSAMFDPSSDPPQPDRTRGAIIVQDAENQPETSNPGEIPANTSVESSPCAVSTQCPSSQRWAADAVSAAVNLSETYDYFLEVHGRNSMDDAGGSILAIVRLGRGYANAFFNPGLDLMAFGDALPFAAALDVVAHELSHGVTFHTSNLLYQNQSGALNEAFSDIFGELVEARASGGMPDWRSGSVLGFPLRDLADPSSLEFAPGQPYPERFGQFVQTSQDNGGVHINSSIVNHAFYQLAVGLPGAIGMEDAGAIFFRGFTLHLTASAQFVDARLACVQAAEELFGIGSAQAVRTAQAFDFVEIFDGPGSGDPPDFPGASGEDATLFLFASASDCQLLPNPPPVTYCLGRREGGDPELGVTLSPFEVAARRPVAVGNGSLAIFVDPFGDLCFIATDGSEPVECLGLPFDPLPIQVNSVGVSPDGSRYGFVLLDPELGQPEALIRVVDLARDQTFDFELRAPALDGGALATVLFADAMDLTADGRLLVYDAFNQISLAEGGSSIGAWSLYAIDLQTGATLTLVPPVAGFDIAFPSLSQTSDNFLTFDLQEIASGETTVTAANLETGALVPVVQNDGFGIPSYDGEDGAIVFSRGDAVPTGTSLMRQGLEADRLTPRPEAPSPWLSDADYGVIYRRGDFVPEPGGPYLWLTALGALVLLRRRCRPRG